MGSELRHRCVNVSKNLWQRHYCADYRARPKNGQKPSVGQEYVQWSSGLVVGWPPLWKIWVNWDEDIPNIWENKKWQPNHQPVLDFSTLGYPLVHYEFILGPWSHPLHPVAQGLKGLFCVGRCHSSGYLMDPHGRQWDAMYWDCWWWSVDFGCKMLQISAGFEPSTAEFKAWWIDGKKWKKKKKKKWCHFSICSTILHHSANATDALLSNCGVTGRQCIFDSELSTKIHIWGVLRRHNIAIPM